jgi:hypothetical protein
MGIEEKRTDIHGVAGVTEKDSYCNSSNMGDRALSLFFKPWEVTEKATYSSCTYDLGRNEANVC